MWASLIVSIAKAIPAIKTIYLQSIDLYYASEERSDQDHMNEVQQERDMLIATLKQPGLTDAQKRVARRRLISLSAE